MKHSSPSNRGRALLVASLTAFLALGCGEDGVPGGLKRTPAGNGPTVRFNLYHKPLPEIPMPNDTAMWPDPTSRTGLRINASLVAPTQIEVAARARFDQLEGWGAFSSISVAFDKQSPEDPRAAIDLAALRARHVGDDYELNDDAVYVVNLSTGVPALMDIGAGAFQYGLRDKQRYWRNDTRRFETNLLFETADETVDPRTGQFDPNRTVNGEPDGLAIYDPRWDTDFDGVLDRPNLLDPNGCANQAQVALGEVAERDRDRCVLDNLLDWYERETDTLMMRPLIPLAEKTRYAVVITDRVKDADGVESVRSPFDFVYHPSQEDGVARLRDHLSNPELQSYYGDIGGTGLTHVAFAWVFTTQPVTEDLRVIRDGMYGQGPFAHLSSSFKPEMTVDRVAGPVSAADREEGKTEPDDWYEQEGSCKGRRDQAFILDFEANEEILRSLAGELFGLEGGEQDELVDSWDSISHAVVGSYESPFLIEGGPNGTAPDAAFNLDYRAGTGSISRDKVQFVLFVPKESETRKQPFDVTWYGHGYTSSWLESFGFAGSMAKQGIATVSTNAAFHGLEMDAGTRNLAQTLGKGFCLAPLIDALLDGRYRDLDGNGDRYDDSGGDFWTSYIFHTRDVVRQSTVDMLQLNRVLKGFDGQRRSEQDYDQDGDSDLAGDFDGDGRVDVGGPGPKYHAWGQSLGGFLSPLHAVLDPDVVSAAPVSGAAGLLDVGTRTTQGGVFEGVYLRNFGPLVVGVPPEEIPEGSTACEPGQISLRFVMVSVNDDREVEFGCLDDQGLVGGGTVLVTNVDNGEKRCARISGDDAAGNGSGRFRLGIPTSINDRVEVHVYDEPDAIDSYHPDTGCNLVPEANRIALIYRWGKGLLEVGAGHPDDTTGGTCSGDSSCTYFEGRYVNEGDRLRALVEGFGYGRQTPDMRRFMALAATAVDPADPANYARYFGLETMTDPWGQPQPATGLLNVVTIGDMNVPLNAGIALGRIAGAVPFLRPDAGERYPAYADYVTPSALYDEIGSRTPNQMILDNYVSEGINHLERVAPENLTRCGRNSVLPEQDTHGCLPSCATNDECDSGTCTAGRCAPNPVSEAQCAQYLFDIEVLDEGQATWGEREANRPLRLGRIATNALPGTIDEIWEPRLAGRPFSSDSGGWDASSRVLAQLMAYVKPRGEHGFDTGNPCQAWSEGRYYTNLLTRFFASRGADIYYLSHPKTHGCLARTGPGSCSFVE